MLLYLKEKSKIFPVMIDIAKLVFDNRNSFSWSACVLLFGRLQDPGEHRSHPHSVFLKGLLLSLLLLYHSLLKMLKSGHKHVSHAERVFSLFFYTL